MEPHTGSTSSTGSTGTPPAEPPDAPFLDRIASADLTARERDVARFYEDSLPGAALLNLEEACRGVGVSSATVAQFARKLGYADFRAMSRSLRAGVRQDLSLPVDRLRWLDDGEDRAPESVLAHRVHLAQASLSASLTSIDEAAFVRACDLVADDDRPLYLGAVASGQPLLHHFCLLLAYLRTGVTLLDGTDRWAHAAAGIDADSVVLAAAFDRSPAPVKALLRLARRREATSILLTNRRTGPLPPLADVLLTTTSPAQDAMFRTRAATLVVLEALLDAVAAHLRRDRHFRTRSAVTPSTSYENVYLDGSGQHAAQAVTFLSHSHRIRQATDTLARRLAPRRRPPQREEHPCQPSRPSSRTP